MLNGLGPGCFIRYFAPADAECPNYSAEVLSQSQFNGSEGQPAFPAACVHDGGSGVSWTCQGRWSSLDPSCKFDYGNALVYLTAEQCQQTTNATVELYSLKLLDNCICHNVMDCIDPEARCVSAGATAPWCPSSDLRCAGLCTTSPLPCPGMGEHCTVSVDGGTCESRLVCRNGEPVCPAEACVLTGN